MKAETYNALAGLNCGFDAALESLKVLQEQGVLTPEYAQSEAVFLEELRAGINHMILEKTAAREQKEWAEFGKMRVTIEERRKGEATTSTADSGTDASRENGQCTQDGAESA